MAQAERSPLPWKQLAVLATVALIEQTAFNSIGPYLPQMTESFPEVKEGQVGLYVGMIASAFALAQFITNFFWGWLSDRIGRKPIILFGTVGSAGAFLAFGFSKTFWHAILAQVMLGLVNGNQGLVATVLGEITDKSNQSRAFTYLPVIFAMGAITGPALGGVLVDSTSPLVTQKKFPYLLPNIVAACLLVIQSLIVMVFLDESLHEINDMPPLGERISGFVTYLWSATTSHLPHSLRWFKGKKDDRNTSPSTVRSASEESHPNVFTFDTILLLITFFVFQLSNVAYNVLYPVFGEGKPPTGRSLSAEEIGFSMASAGVLAILFQIFIYGPVRTKLGNRGSYRLSHLLFALAFSVMPFVGYIDGEGFGQGRKWVWAELGLSLAIKTIAAVGGLTCAMLMVCGHHSSLINTTNLTDHKLSSRPRPPWSSQRLGSNAFRCRSSYRAVCVGRTLLCRNSHQTQRRGFAVWNLCGYCRYWLCFEYWNQR
jgi:MFS family permease